MTFTTCASVAPEAASTAPPVAQRLHRLLVRIIRHRLGCADVGARIAERNRNAGPHAGTMPSHPIECIRRLRHRGAVESGATHEAAPRAATRSRATSTITSSCPPTMRTTAKLVDEH